MGRKPKAIGKKLLDAAKRKDKNSPSTMVLNWIGVKEDDTAGDTQRKVMICYREMTKKALSATKKKELPTARKWLNEVLSAIGKPSLHVVEE